MTENFIAFMKTEIVNKNVNKKNIQWQSAALQTLGLCLLIVCRYQALSHAVNIYYFIK